MPNKSTLITGACGLVGYPLTKYLTTRGDRVIGLDPADPVTPVDGMIHVKRSFGNFDMLLGLLREHNIDRIVHAGGISGPMLAKDDPHRINRVNLISTIDLAEAARQAGISRLVYCSSGSAYGVTRRSPVTEDTPFRPTSVYGATKAASDLVLMAYRDEYDLDAVGLRYSSVYGPRRATDCAIRTMIEDAMANRPTNLNWGAGKFWPFVYVDDIVTATAAALDTAKTSQYAYNIAGPDMPSIQRIAELVYEAFPNANIELGSDPRRDERGQFDLSAAERDLSWVPEWDIERGVKAYIQWFLAQEPG
ncbi:MAG: dTDP-glucose 4,6-dehydratase 2 [Alphaproteobacteria bacterium MarineAlpha4_Bin2]|nr:MAG: dTDP-glucose 4,6-dehydratase 2 [Alphaproteobacteria bacterium MarineAlpha4_Bin2]